MSNIKVAFKEVIELLEANANKKVSTIMPQILEMVSTKVASKTFKLNDEGEVTHIFCYYHKEWEDVTEVEYGPKKSSASGLNTMCKRGVSNWTKQQRLAKKAKAELLPRLVSGEITAEQIPELEAEIEAQRTAIN